MRGNKNLISAIGIDPQVITGAAAPGTVLKGAAVDRQGFEEALVTLQHGAVAAGGNLSVKVQESPTTTDGDFVDVADAAFAPVAGGAQATSGVYVGRLHLSGRKRYLRVVVTVLGADKTALVSALMTLHLARELPVFQVNALAFEVN